MNISKKYLEKLREFKKLENQNQLALYMDISRHNISNYYNGRRNLDNYMCFRIADELNINPAIIIADVEAEKSKFDKKKAYFTKKLASLAMASCLILLPLSASAANIVAYPSNTTSYILYAYQKIGGIIKSILAKVNMRISDMINSLLRVKKWNYSAN
jgi:transcriptional regulator with XRE-family HTH domain